MTAGLRLVVLDGGRAVLRGLTVAPFVASWPPKDPSESFTDYGVDFAALLPAGGTVVQLDRAVIPAGALLINRASYAGSVVTLAIGGGVDATTPVVAVRLTLGDGTVISRSVLLPVVAGAGAIPPPLAGGLSLNGSAVSVGGQPISVAPAPPPAGTGLSINGAPLTVGGEAISLLP